MLCIYCVVGEVDNHTGGYDQQECKNIVHADLGPGGNYKRGCAPILG
jgi:hypothetical protein